MVGVLENCKTKRSVEVSFGELTEVAVPPSAQAFVRQLEDLTGRIQARSLRKHHSLMGFQACDYLVHGGLLRIVYFLEPIPAKFVPYAAIITFFKRLSDVGGVSGVVTAEVSFLGCDFFEQELSFSVVGFISLVNPFEFEVDGVESEAEVALGDVIRVFLVVIHRFLDGSGLQVAEVSAVLWLVVFVQLVHGEHSLTRLESLHEVGQGIRELG